MAKNSFLEFSTTAGDNTDIGGIGILGTNAVSNFDNAFRTIMAILRRDLDNGVVLASKSGAYTAVANDNNAALRFTSAATLSLTAAATLGADWHCAVMAVGGDVTIDPDAAETINGDATLILKQGESAIVYCDGTDFFADVSSLPPVTIYPTIVAKSANYTALDADYLASIRFTAAATLALDVTANLRTNWRIEVWNDSTGNVTIDPDSTDTINGGATLILQPGQKAEIFKTGTTTFQASVFGTPLSGPQIQGYVYGLALTTNASDAANDVDIAAGAAASDASPFYLMQLTSALTKRIDAAWAVGTNQGGLDTGTVGNNTYYIWLIQRSDTLVTDALFSLSSSAPTMPANYDRKRLVGMLVRASGTNSIPQFIANGINGTGEITLSSTAVDITGIPANARNLILTFSNVTLSANGQPILLLGTSGGLVSTGYKSVSALQVASSTGAAEITTAFAMAANASYSGPMGGVLTLARVGNSNSWAIEGTLALTASGLTNIAGYVTLPSALSQMRLTTVAGTPTFTGKVSLDWR